MFPQNIGINKTTHASMLVMFLRYIRGMIGQIRAQLIAIAKEKHQTALLIVIAHPEKDKCKMAGKVINAIDQLKIAVVLQPLISDAVGM